MSYCVNCGVKLADYHEECPLCNTKVINPNAPIKKIKKDYPDYRAHIVSKNKSNFIRRIIAVILSLIFFMCAVVPVLINIMGSKTVSWSLYSLSSMVLIWIGVALPFIIKKIAFLKLFTLDCFSGAIYLLVLNLIISSDITWAKYASAGIIFMWMIMLGIVKSDKVVKQLSIKIYFIIVAIVFLVLYSYWIGDRTMLTGLFLPIYGTILFLFLVSVFLVKAKVQDAFGFVAVILSDVAILAFFTELIISKFLHGSFTFSWSFIVLIGIIPLIIAMIIISKNKQYRVYLSKKFHR